MRRLAPLACALVLLATGCAPAPADTDEAPLRILNSFVAQEIDPARSGAQWCWEFGYCEHPMRLGDSGELEPWLLTDLAQVDELTWRLTLREEITFQNGAELDAAALAASLQRQLDEFPQLADLLPGATAEPTGELEVTLSTTAPTAIVAHLLAERTYFPVYDAAAVQAAGPDADLSGEGIFTGPYAVTALTEERLTLARYDRYWAGEPALPGVEVRFVSDDQARLLGVQNGEADIALYAPSGVRDVVEGRTDVFLRRQPVAQETLRLAPNVGEGLTSELAVRRALAMAVDYEALAQEVMGGLYDTAIGMYPPSLPFAVDNQRTDPEEAATVLDEAGWEPGSDGVRTRDGQRLELTLLTYPQQPDTATHAVGIQAQLAEVGIDVDIRQVEDINAALDGPGDWNLVLIFNGTVVSSGDPVVQLRRYLHSTSQDNAGRYGVDDPELDTLIEDLERTFDDAERDRLLREIQELVMSEQHYLIIASLKPFPILVGPDWADYELFAHRRLVDHETAPSG